MIQLTILFSAIFLGLATKQILISENEKYCFQKKGIMLQTNISENQEITNAIIQNYTSEITKELIVKYKNFTLSQPSLNIFTFQNENNDEIYICFNKISTIECNFKIMNYVNNDQLVIFEDQYYLFDQTNCKQIYNIEKNLFILEFQNENGRIFKLIDKQNQIQDVLELSIDLNSSIYIQEVKNRLIIVQNQNTQFLVIEVQIYQSKFRLSKNIYDIRQFKLDKIGEIKHLLIQNQDNIKILCQYTIFDIDQIQKKIINGNIEIFENCEIIGSFIYQNSPFFLVKNPFGKNEISLNQHIIFINILCEEMLSFNIINENIIINCQKELYVINNDFIYKKFDLNSNSIYYLGYLPYILSLKNKKELEILKVNDLPYCINQVASTNLFYFQVNQFKLNYIAQMYSTQNYSLKHPQLLISLLRQNEVLYVNSNFIYYNFNKPIQIGLPFTINAKKVDNSTLVDVKNQFSLKQFQNYNWGSHAFLIGFNSNNDYVILVINDQTISITNFKDTKTFKFQKYDHLTNPEILFCIESQNFVIIYNNIIKAFRYEFKIELIWTVKVTKKIIKIQQNSQFINIHLEGCHEIQIQIYDLQYQIVNNTLQFGCTYIMQNQMKLQITEHEIDIEPYSSYRIKHIFQRIIDFIHFILEQRLILFELIEEQIKIQLYIIKPLKLQYLYQLPLYHFNIIYPLKYKIQKQLLAIVAKDINNNQEMLLVFNLKNQLANCLIQVIQIDQNEYYFDIIKDYLIFFIFKQQLQVYNLRGAQLIFSSNLQDMDTYFTLQQELIEFKSDIYNQSQESQIEVLLVNTKYNLTLRDDRIPLKCKFDVQNQINILNFENVIGPIDSVQYFKENEMMELSPIIKTPFIKCQFYYNKICRLGDKAVIYNSKKQITVHFPKSCRNMLFQKQSHKNLEIYCFSHNFNIEKYELRENILNKIQEQSLISATQGLQDHFQRIEFIENIGITLNYINENEIFLFKEENLQQFEFMGQKKFQIVKIIYEQEQYIIFCYNQMQYDFISVFLLNSEFSIVSNLEIMMEKIIATYNSQYFSIIQQIQILNYNLRGKNFENEIILCFQTQICYKSYLIMDFENKSVQSSTINYIRYPYTDGKLQYFFVNQQHLIIQLIIDQETVLYYYNLISFKILDSYYKERDKNITVDYFNETHFVQIKYEDSFQIISFIQIIGYQFQYQNCRKSIQKIQLNNNVSTLILEVYPDLDQNLICYNTVQSLVCLVNLFLLLIFLKIYSHRNKFKK